MRVIHWIVKLSKLCNLRCAYCYEWNDLDKRERMSPALLGKVFQAIRAHHYGEMKRTGTQVRSEIIWHGGEPLILPISYLELVQRTKYEVIGAQARQRAHFPDSVQTNLYQLRDETIDLLKRHRIAVGVSLDVVPGVRRTIAGGDSEARVLANLERLRAAEIDVGAITVLARHTIAHVEAIYDFFAARGISMRALPLFPGPSERPEAMFAVGDDEIVDAMCRLFDRWIDDGAPRPLAPLDEYLRLTIRSMLGLAGVPYDRRSGENHLMVDLDGTVYHPGDGYDPALALGNLHGQTIEEILASPAREKTLVRDDRRRASTCGGCEYRGACGTYPAFDSRREGAGEGRCTIAYRVCQHIERRLREAAISNDDVRELLREQLGGSTDVNGVAGRPRETAQYAT